ncbi:MAG: twin-arginine translocase TatA/TatE family subunit [Solirubrobacteraceae bacterium]
MTHFPEASKMFRNPATDLIVVLIIVLLILGPKRLPGLGKGLGQGMREFKEGITGSSKDEEEQQPAITPTASTPDPGANDGPEHAPAADRGSAEVGSERNT